MKKSQYNNEQIVQILREMDQDTVVVNMTKRHRVSTAFIYACQKRSRN